MVPRSGSVLTCAVSTRLGSVTGSTTVGTCLTSPTPAVGAAPWHSCNELAALLLTSAGREVRQEYSANYNNYKHLILYFDSL